MKGWVDLGYPAMHRPGVELAIFRSRDQRPNHYTTERPYLQITSDDVDYDDVILQRSCNKRL